MCFVVSRKIRGQGVAASLLAAAIDFARAHGATTLEAYPIDATDGRVPAANAFHGTLAMFERAGFTVVERRQWNPTTPVRPIVRLELRTAPHEAVRVPCLTRRDPTTSSVASATSSSVRVDIAFAAPLDCRPGRDG